MRTIDRDGYRLDVAAGILSTSYHEMRGLLHDLALTDHVRLTCDVFALVRGDLKISVHSRGETNPNAKVTEIQVALIKGLLYAGARCEDVGPAFGISADTVSRIKNGQSWPHVIAAPVSAEGNICWPSRRAHLA